MENNKDLAVILGDGSKKEDHLMVDSHFLISQCDYVRAKAHFDGNETVSIKFPGVDRATWDEAMKCLDPLTWLSESKRESITEDVFHKIASFYQRYCFSNGLGCCNWLCETLPLHKKEHYSGDNFAIAKTAVNLDLASAQKVKDKVKQFFKFEFCNYQLPYWYDEKPPNLAILTVLLGREFWHFLVTLEVDSAIAFFSCFDARDAADETMRRSLASVILCYAFGEDETLSTFGIRVKAFKQQDYHEIIHYLNEEAIETILSHHVYLAHVVGDGRLKIPDIR